MSAAGETFVIYGDLMLWNCYTPQNGFSQEAVLTDDGVDLLYYKFRIAVVGWVTNLRQSSAVVGSLPDNGQVGVGNRQAGMRYAISPRLHFEYHTGAIVDGLGNITDPGSTTLRCDPIINAAQAVNAAGFDLNAGPKCLRFDVVQVTSDNLFQVEAEFEVCMLTCDIFQAVYNTSGVLSNRWSVEDSIDENMMTTRTTVGRLRTTSGVINPNQFRNFIIPGVQPGMRRVSIDVVVTTDSMNLLYTIVDTEIAYAAPAPATSWSLDYSESASREGQLSKTVNVSVTLTGDRYVNKRKLIALAASIARAKIKNTKGQFVLLENTVIDRYGDNDNSITLNAVARRFNGASVMGLPTDILGIPIAAADIADASPNYDSRLSRGARAGDQIEVQGPIPLAAAFSTYLQQPCNQFHAISQSTLAQTPSGTNPPPSTTVSTAESSSIADDGSNNYFNTVANANIYTYYSMDVTHESSSGRAQMPIASSGSPSSGAPTSVVVDLYPRMTKRHVRLRGERIGAWPDFPQMPDDYTDSNGIKYKLLDTVDNPVTPDRAIDGQQVYTWEREYTYAMSRSPNANDKLSIGVNPWENSTTQLKQFDSGVAETSYPLA